MAATGRVTSGGRTKILFILDAFPDPHAGTEGQFWLLFNMLDRTRFEPAILLLRHSTFLQENVRNAQVRVLDVRSLRSVSGFWRILKSVLWARREGYRIAHIFFNDSALVFPPLLKLAGLKAIVSRRDLGFWYTRGNLKLLRFNARCVDAVVANCEAVKKVVIREEGYPPEKIRVIYNGLTRRIESPQSERLREQMGLPQSARLLVLVANLRPLKRIDDAIRALAGLGVTHGDVRLLVVGEDREGSGGRTHRDELTDVATAAGVTGKVHFLGKIADPMPVIHAADVCLLCSETEGLSNTIIEYMFAGKPVVCTDVGGNSELVRSGWSGACVRVGDVAEMVNAIARLLDNPELSRISGENARNYAIEIFSPEAMLDSQCQMYDELAVGPSNAVPAAASHFSGRGDEGG